MRSYSLWVIGFLDKLFLYSLYDSTLLCFVIFVVDELNRSNPIFVQFYKAQRIEQSVLGGKLIGFRKIFNHAVSLENKFNGTNLEHKASIRILMDNKPLSDIYSMGSRTSEHHMLFDNVAVKKAYRNEENSNTELFRSGNNIAFWVTEKISQTTPSSSLGGQLLFYHVQWKIKLKTGLSINE